MSDFMAGFCAGVAIGVVVVIIAVATENPCYVKSQNGVLTTKYSGDTYILKKAKIGETDE